IVLDGLGEPIPDATIILISPGSGTPPLTLTTNIFGGVTIPDMGNRSQFMVRFSHKRFGTASLTEPYRIPRAEAGGQRLPPTPLCVPLVAKDSPAYARSLRGQVVATDGKSIAGAEVSCRSIRTPSQGVIYASGPAPSVPTDDDGRFAIYMPRLNSPADRDSLIPLHAVYQVAVRAPGVGAFPYTGEHDNAVPAVIQIMRPEHFHRFEFETVGGGRVRGPEADSASLIFRPTPSTGINLDSAYIREGGKLMPGFYFAQIGNLEYLPVEVTKDSPEVLLFRLPPPKIFRGQVLDGATGKPMPGAFLVTEMSETDQILATLKEADWTALEALPANPPANTPGLAALRSRYYFRSLHRTDDQGRYEVVVPPTDRVSGLTAFARDRLPCSYNTYWRTWEDKSPLPNLPLFPAARVTLESVGQGSSITARWELDPEATPEWYGRLSAFLETPPAWAQIVQSRRLQANQPHTILVPAGVKLTLALHTPTDDSVCTARVAKPIQLPAGGSLDVGKVTFEPALAINVRVIGPDGKPVEGVLVRRMYLPAETWARSSATDSNGLARFHVQKNSHGYFAVGDSLPVNYVRARPGSGIIPFEVGEAVPKEPPTIHLTADQTQTLPDRQIDGEQ
ncbi:MAG: hypothetical protein NTV86_20755, partial [Planctomycetota bacterium]|nr:hypothetical protein [Planctomycetota bacterium]